MAVLDVPAPVDGIAPIPSTDVRPSVEVAAPRYSSSEARAFDTNIAGDHSSDFAAQLGTTERGLGTAEGMIRRHLATAGGGVAGQISATLEGVRRARLSAPGLVVEGDGDDLSFGIALIADPLVLLVVARPHQGLHWSLLPGGPSVTARADGLRLIRGLAAGGELTLSLGTREAFPPIVVDGGEWLDEDEWRLFEDLAVVEEWSGVTLPISDTVSAEEATAAAQAASWARTQQVDARVDGTITFGADVALDAESIDELRVHQEFDIRLSGLWVPMGKGAARVALQRVEQQPGAKPTFRAFPARSDVYFALAPPAGRRLPPRRTQPEYVAPPAPRPQPGHPRRTFKKPARRKIVDVLAATRAARRIAPGEVRGTIQLLDDIRGE